MAAQNLRGMVVIGLLDTNVALYLLDARLADPLPLGRYGVSVITEMELLAWPSLTPPEEAKVCAFLQVVTLCELSAAVRFRAVRLRRQERLKLPGRHHRCHGDGAPHRALDESHPALRCSGPALPTGSSPFVNLKLRPESRSRRARSRLRWGLFDHHTVA